jgi:membrane-associated protease RseP (regulator of RpoE activity)
MQLMVNLDMVGRPQQGKMYVHGVDTAKGLRDTVREQAERAPPIALKVEVGGESSLRPEAVGTVHPGADDNASGVAALLQVARALAAGPPPRRAVLLAAFGAEELGLLGSAHLARNLPAACPLERLQLMVNLDMVGRPSRGKVYVDGADTARGLRDLVTAWAGGPPRLPLQVAFGGDGYGPSDHTSFYARGVPVLFLFTGAHGDYHRPSDTVDRIDPEGLAAVARLALRAADGAARGPRLEVVRVPPPPGAGAERAERRGYGAYLGAVPDFEERREPGVLLSGVRPGSPAEGAGLRAGDLLLEVGGQRLLNLQDLAYALRARRPGDAVELVWRREGSTLRARATLAERR